MTEALAAFSVNAEKRLVSKLPSSELSMSSGFSKLLPSFAKLPERTHKSLLQCRMLAGDRNRLARKKLPPAPNPHSRGGMCNLGSATAPPSHPNPSALCKCATRHRICKTFIADQKRGPSSGPARLAGRGTLCGVRDDRMLTSHLSTSAILDCTAVGRTPDLHLQQCKSQKK